jgi:hypothetical protein
MGYTKSVVISTAAINPRNNHFEVARADRRLSWRGGQKRSMNQYPGNATAMIKPAKAIPGRGIYLKTYLNQARNEGH